jgi:hypothetical protein
MQYWLPTQLGNTVFNIEQDSLTKLVIPILPVTGVPQL